MDVIELAIERVFGLHKVASSCISKTQFYFTIFGVTLQYLVLLYII